MTVVIKIVCGETLLKLTRRDFLKLAGITSLTVIAGSRYFKAGSLAPKQQQQSLKIVRSVCSPNCTGACAYNAYVYDGRIVALMQPWDYPEEEYNPRGCLKGLSMLNLIYGPDRLKKPLLRAEGAKRGEGKFTPVDWDTALDYVAEKLVQIMQQYGPESIAVSVQVPGTGYAHKGALIRLASMLGWSVLHGYSMNGDLPMFWPMTFGVQSEELESLEWTNSKYIAIFGSNIAVTRLPDAKMLELAVEKGAKVIMVDPNFTPTAAKAHEWIPINPSTDAAFALGIVHVIIRDKLYDEEFVKKFTDLPLLIRLDNKKKLKASEVAGLDPSITIPPYRELYVVYDQDTGELKVPNPEDLSDSANPFNPALEVDPNGIEVPLKGGGTVRVKPAFQLLKEKIMAEYSPEQVAQIVAPEPELVSKYVEIIERIAKEMATIKPLHIIYGASNYQWYHGDLKGRALSLIVALTGNLGKPGAGISTYAGQYKIRWPLGAWWKWKGQGPKWVPYLLWMNPDYMNTQELQRYATETPYPPNGVKAFIFGWNNPFDQHNMANRLKEMAETGELELIVAIDFQMTTSCNWADAVLPGVSWYEKYELTATILHPYVQLQQPAIEPLFESMPEIWIIKELARRIVDKLGDDTLKSQIAEFYPDPTVFNQEEEARRNGTWSLQLARELANQATLDAIQLMLETGGPLVEGITLDDLFQGPVRMNLPTPNKRQIPFWEQINERRPFPPQSYPLPLEKTARFVKSGRIEFYKDEDVFLDLGEELPVHKDPFEETEYRRNPEARTKYPYVYITRNSLYRVHSTHSNNITMLELQDFKPKIWMNPKTAQEKGIKEGDLVRAYNDRGEVVGYAAFDPGLHPKVIIFVQGWWSRYLRGKSYNTLTFPWVKPTSLAYYAPGTWEPTTKWNEALCDIEKIE